MTRSVAEPKVPPFEAHPIADDVTKFRRLKGQSVGDGNSANAIIHGENAATLAALGPCLTGKVRCIYLDPPYNNGERYTHFNDDVDHAQWLRGMVARLGLLAPLLRDDGSIWISIDDGEVHYLKTAADRIFGRSAFMTTVVWQHRTTRENRRAFSVNHEYILVYAKDPRAFTRRRNRLQAGASFFQRYRNPDDDPRGPWQSVSANVQGGHGTSSQWYGLRAPNGRVHWPPKGRCWAYAEPRIRAAIANGEIWFGGDGNGVPRLKKFLRGSVSELTPNTIWPAGEVGTTLEAKKHILQLLPDAKVFDTPKPERLLQRILYIASDPGDVILDPYLGSGTTAAVAHKLGRRYVGIEENKDAIDQCAARLKLVVRGEAGGASEDAGWKGGGEFDCLRYLSP